MNEERQKMNQKLEEVANKVQEMIPDYEFSLTLLEKQKSGSVLSGFTSNANKSQLKDVLKAVIFAIEQEEKRRTHNTNFSPN